jgi:hypothetical protein
VWATYTPRTYVVYDTTYYYNDGVWYTRALQEGETVYVMVSAPEGLELESLPGEPEVMEADGQTYYLSENTFYRRVQRDGKDLYVVVDAPAGAQVSSVPEGVVEHDEGGETVYQYDETFYTTTEDDSGNQVYEVQPVPAEEEIDEIPQSTVTFVADEETYYYVDRAMYVAAEGGGYVMSEPPLGSVAQKLPDGATVINEGEELYFQLDTVFFKPLDSSSETAYKVIASPDGSEIADETAEET